jgi:hypothetical protein
VGGSCTTYPVVKRLEARMQEKMLVYQTLDCPGWMKSIFYITMVLPYVYWTLSIWTLAACQLRSLDKTLRKTCKQFEGLRASTCNAAIHAPNSLGGYGYLSLELQGPLRFTIPFLRRLFLADAESRGVQWAVLRKEATRLCANIPDTEVEQLLTNPAVFASLMDDKTSLDISTAMTLLARTNVEFVRGRKRLLPPFRTDWGAGRKPQTVKDRLAPIITKLRRLVYEDSHGRWAAYQMAGETMRGVPVGDLAPQNTSCPWMRFPWSFSAGVRNFAFLCQTNGINCRWNWSRWFGGPKSCTLCGAATESTAHVLNRCSGRLHIYRLRHDAALAVFQRALRGLGFRVLIDQVCPETGDTLRPDVQLYKYRNAAGVEIYIAHLADMKCPWPRGDFVSRTHTRNVEKYANLTLQVKRKYPNVEMDTIIVPTTGPMPKHTLVALTKVLGAKLAGKTLCNMSAAVARANFKLRSTLCMQKPTGTTPRRVHVEVPDEEEIDPREYRVDDALPPDIGEDDLDARAALPQGANPMDSVPPIQAPLPAGAGAPPDGRHAD